MFEKASKGLEVQAVDIDDCLQPNLQHPSEIHPNRVQFEEDYKKHGFKYVFNKYGEVGWRFKVRRKFKKIIDRFKKKFV